MPRTYHTPPELAELWGISHRKVLAWIQSGELVAVDMATSQGERPRWRISAEAAAEFLARRTAKPPEAKPVRRRRRRGSEAAVDFFPGS